MKPGKGGEAMTAADPPIYFCHRCGEATIWQQPDGRPLCPYCAAAIGAQEVYLRSELELRTGKGAA